MPRLATQRGGKGGSNPKGGSKQEGELAGLMLDAKSNEEVIATGARRQAEQYAQASHTEKKYKEGTMILRWWQRELPRAAPR